MRGYFAQVRRTGFDIGLSAGKLTKAMVEVLSQLPSEATPSKDVVVQHLGLLGQMSGTRDINAAWNSAKRQMVREHPHRFCLDGKVLRWASDMEGRPRQRLSTAGQRKLAALAAREGITPDELLGRLISARGKAKGITWPSGEAKMKRQTSRRRPESLAPGSSRGRGHR
jgi:hypothetical protein